MPISIYRLATMDNATDYTNQSSCLVSQTLVVVFNLVRGGAGVVSLLGCIALILAMAILKKYKDPAQRIVLYLTIAVIINSINSIVRGAGYQLVGDTPFCVAVGFLSSYSSGCILLAICCIVTELFLKAVLNKATGNCVSVIYLLFIFIQPLVVFVLPFFTNTYGQSGPTCWIKSINYDNCTQNIWGVATQYILWNIPIFFLFIIGSLFYIITLAFFNRKLKKYHKVYTSERNRMISGKALEDIKLFRWYPLVFFGINVIPFLTRLANLIDKNLPMWLVLVLWIISALIEGLQGFFISLAFTLDSKTRQSLRWTNIKEAFVVKCLRRTNEDFMYVEYKTANDSATARQHYEDSSSDDLKESFLNTM